MKSNGADRDWVKVMVGQMCLVARGLVVLICSKTEIQIQKLYPCLCRPAAFGLRRAADVAIMPAE